MTSLVFNPQTATLLNTISENMPHALLLDGKVGTGLYTTALSLAKPHLQSVVNPTNVKGEIDTESGSIKIAQIRELYEATKGISTEKRVIILDDADTMGIPAQNAFLKLLEEPSTNTYFILTAHRPEKLLPTIISRVQRLHINEITTEQTKQLVDMLVPDDTRKKSQLLYVAQGLPAELTRLASDTLLFESKVTYMTDARTLLQGTMLEKIKVVNAYHLKRTDTLQLIEAAQIILERSLAAGPKLDMVALANRLADVHERVVANGNVRLQLLSVVV